MFDPSAKMRLVTAQRGLACPDSVLCSCESMVQGDSRAAWTSFEFLEYALFVSGLQCSHIVRHTASISVNFGHQCLLTI